MSMFGDMEALTYFEQLDEWYNKGLLSLSEYQERRGESKKRKILFPRVPNPRLSKASYSFPKDYVSSKHAARLLKEAK